MDVRRVLVTSASAVGLLAAWAPSAGAADLVQVKGQHSGTYQLVYALAPSPCRPGELPVTATVTGTLSHVGRIAITGSQCSLFDPKNGTFTARAGVFVLTTPSGSTLAGTYTGSGALTPTGVSSTNQATVLTGTGRFVGTTGSLLFEGTATSSPRELSEVISGTLSR